MIALSEGATLGTAAGDGSAERSRFFMSRSAQWVRDVLQFAG